MAGEERLLRQFFANPANVIESVFTIDNEYGEVVPFRLTPIQRHYLEASTGRDIDLKPRQVRVSSIILARNAVLLATRSNTNALVTTDAPNVTQKFRLRLKHHFDDLRKLGIALTYDLDNEDHLHVKETNNSIFFTEAGSTGVGRGMAFGIVHMSEVAFWRTQAVTPGQAIAGILASVPPGFGQVDVESTPFGAAGAFYEMVVAARRGANEFSLHFWPWWWEARYRADTEAPPPYSAIESVLMQEHGLDLYQLQWRRGAVERMRPTGTPFEQEYPEDPETCFLSSEASWLTADIIIRLRKRILPPIAVVDGGLVRVYKKPQPGHSYVAGIDTAQGIVTSLTSDAHACQILDARTMEQVAVIHALIPINDFADLCHRYLQQYNMAYTGIELPGPGAVVISRLEALNYTNLHWQEADDNWRPGWLATSQNINTAIADLYTALDGGGIIVYDEETVSQLAGMQWHIPKLRRSNRFARAGAAYGGHDDLVFALSVAHQVAPFAPVSRVGLAASEGVGVV